ncbi:MAG: hypothetical protein ACRD0O_01610, partial [Acidimicrobiia bacterium]
MTLGAARAVVAGTLVAICLAGASPPVGAGPARRVERVLIVTLPGVTWEDLHAARVPHLRGLVTESAVASTSLRVFHRGTHTAEGYATLGAGALLDGHRRLAARARPDPDGGTLSPALPMLTTLAAGRHRGAEPGALGDALAVAGVARAVVANADTSAGDTGNDGWHREAALALAGGDGRVPGGTVAPALLAADPAAPF